MIRGYLFYERKDAKTNARFIEQLQHEASLQQIDLQLHFSDELASLPTDVAFVWNRSRQSKVAQYFEKLGIRVFNNARTNKIANDKLLAQQFVEGLHIQTIPSWQHLEQVTSYPVVLKSIDGHGGQEVWYCADTQQLRQQLQQPNSQRLIIQPFIASNAQDVRVWMLGNDILGAVLRTGTTSFKSNYTLGGTIEKFPLPHDLKVAAQRITTELQSDYIGIDFIKGMDGTFYFNELEDPVGAKSYYDLYDHLLAKRLITYLKQRISLANGD